MDWHRCKFLESSDNLKPLIKRRFGREPNTSTAREIIACLQQGRLFYEAAERSPLEIAPLQLFYGMVGFSKALIMASGSRSLAALKPAHGICDTSAPASRIADLRLKIGTNGTFQEFNDVVARLSRVCYMDFVVNEGRTVYLSTTDSSQLDGISLSIQEILSRIPGLDALYHMTFGEEALSALVSIQLLHGSSDCFQIQVWGHELFSDRESLKQIVERWRDRFPVLKRWRLVSAQYTWGDTNIWFQNLPVGNLDEFCEEYAVCSGGSFHHTPAEPAQRFGIKEGLGSAAGYLQGGTTLISPVHGVDLSEFSLHYLGLFLLSSLVRYRPQIWAHAVSRSAFSDKPVDDRMLSLIGKFLDINRSSIPELVVQVLNPSEDFYSRYRNSEADESRI
jgi:YaaC-like Protein